MTEKMRVLPAYPLFVKDPFFSFWSQSDVLNESDVCFWQGEKKPIYGLVIADGEKYCFLGVRNDCKKLKQESIEVTALSTVYTFTSDAFDLKIDFLSPLPPTDIDLLSCPVCFLRYSVIPKRAFRSLSVVLSVSDAVCYGSANTDKRIRGDSLVYDGFECAYMGLDRQQVLSLSADNVSCDWGYYSVAGRRCAYHDETERDIAESGEGEFGDTFAGKQRFITAADDYKDIDRAIEGKLLIAFDDVCSIYYFGELLKGYYFKDGKTIVNAICESYLGFDEIAKKCAHFERKFADKFSGYGSDYLGLCYASLRQSVGAHKAVVDKKGRLLFLSKECSSGGCIATVDVTYASMPLFLVFNPKLVEGMLYPIFDFSRMPVWEEDFAPHDVGVYPYCFGQYYAVKKNGSGKRSRQLDYQDGKDNGVLPRYYLYPAGSDIYDIDRQMPVEECSDMIIVTALCAKRTGNLEIAHSNYDLLGKWADYLVKKGIVPEKQLCTDDFMGHVDKNVNLSIKAAVALYAFSLIGIMTGREPDARLYERIAKERAREISERFLKHLPLAFDGGEDTYSLKYNLAADKMLGANLFDRKLFEREVDLYISKSNVFGCPLDHRKSFTKSDWLTWVAALTEDEDKRRKLIEPLSKFLTDSPQRVPYSDWYDSVTGEVPMFLNRPVQGGIYVLPLVDKK